MPTATAGWKERCECRVLPILLWAPSIASNSPVSGSAGLEHRSSISTGQKGTYEKYVAGIDSAMLRILEY